MVFKEKMMKRSLLAQLLFVMLSFLAIAVLSYVFMNNIVRQHLMKNSENVLSFLQSRIESDLREPVTTLRSISETLRLMVINGSDETEIQSYITDLSDYIQKNGHAISSFNGFYAYFETLPGGPVFINGIGWDAPEDYSPPERLWYQIALDAHGEIAETSPYVDAVTGETVFTYARCIYDESMNRLGVVALDIRLGVIAKYVVDTVLAQSGYGVLVGQDFKILAHPNPDYVSKYMGDQEIQFSKYKDWLQNDSEIFSEPTLSYKNEPSLIFFKKLANGWYLGLVAPEAPYYESISSIAKVLGSLALVFAVILSAILIRIDGRVDKSDIESKHKSAFLANMSHEIRTPMNAIIGMTFLGKNAVSIERKDYCFRKIEDAGLHLLGVINDILDISKIEANKLELSSDTFVFEHMLRQAVNVVNFRMDEKQQRFSMHIDSGIPEAFIGDSQRLSQVIVNLLGNASKFTPENGSISLDARLLGEDEGFCDIRFAVRDTGIGIGDEQQKKLFKAFEQAETSTTRKYGGTGLGLAISKQIIEMMGGKIEVESELGKGTAFIFTAKLKIGDKKALNESAKKDRGAIQDVAGIFEGRRILLAEDVEINREIAASLLEPTLIKIDCAKNGIEAFHMFAGSPEKYDLVFMDVQMPEMDGYESTRRIRALKTQKAESVPIIAMTANVFRDDIERCLEAGMNGHIAKPIDYKEIINKLRSYLT